MNDGDEFYLQVAFALSGCQLVEEELKLYISQALDLVRKCVGQRMVFKINGSDFEDASLERLIQTFRKLTNNDALVKDLETFKRERNYLSHKGISHHLDPNGELTDVSEFQMRLKDIQVEADRLRHAIHNEANHFLGHLYFEVLPE
jgi:hypothetical protein